MHLGTIILLGIAINLDNLCVGLCYGLAKKRIPWGSNLVIALISGAFASVACVIARWMIGGNGAVAAIVSALLLAGLGVYTLYGALRGRPEADGTGEEPKTPGGWETAALGVSLAVNCLGASFGLGLSDVSWVWLGAFVTLFSFLAVGIGGHLGVRMGKLCEARWLDAASGVMLIAIAVWEMFI